MKLYRYRPLSAFLFKELLYSEIYQASPTELNDPLDLNGQLNFYTDSEAEIRMLVHFVFVRAFVSCGQRTLLRELQAVMSFETLGIYIRAKLAQTTDVVVSKSRLFDILSSFYAEIVSIEKGLEELKVERLLSALDEIFTQFLDNSCVACFSETNTNFLMWSHYASGHTGICLEFEVPVDSENGNTCRLPVLSDGLFEGKFLEWAENVRKVSYRDSLSTISFYKYLPLFNNAYDVDVVNLSKSCWHQYAQGIADIFLQKLPPWSEEKEWRLITTHFKNQMPEDRLFRYNSNALTGVYFGARSSEQTKERVRNILEKANNAISFYQCSVDGTRGVVVEKV